MSLSKLPPECLNLILKVLQRDRVALSCLLRVNRSLCSAALPYLYRRALSWDTSLDYGHGRPDIVYIPRLLKIVQLLLQRLPRKNVSKLLCAAFDIGADESTKEENEQGDSTEESGIKYLSYIRAFDFEKVIYMTRFDPSQSDIDILQNYPRRLANYVFRSKTSFAGGMQDQDQGFIAASGYGDGAHDEELFLPSTALAPGTEAKLRHDALEASLRRELAWTLCSPVFEQIQEISIPLSDLGRYLESVCRFTALTSISFIMDEPFLDADSDHGPGTTTGLSPDATESNKRRYQQFRNMIQFVERHERAFPGQLQFARCPSAFPCRVSMQCPGAVKNELSCALSMMARPTYIGHNNWRRVYCKLKEIDLGSVKTIRLLNQQNEAGALFAKADPTFLSRCRNLKSLDMDPLGTGSFQWAVEEKQAWDHYNSLPPLRQDGYTEQHLNRRSTPQPLPPIPLQTVAMLLNRRMLTDELDNIAFAFSDTLSHIQIFQCASGDSLELPLEFRLGRDWRLPEIKTIAVSLVRTKLVVDLDFYQSGRLGSKVQLLQLVDRRTGPYRFQDVVSCRPVSNTLPFLTVIKLRGWPALTFHPESLRHTPGLQFLCLDIDRTLTTDDDAVPWTVEDVRASVFFVQEEEGGDENAAGESIISGESTHAQRCRRPLWTWDWHLPHLTTLALGPVFAYLFEFRMLESCPAVEVLELTLGSDVDDKERTLSIQDFMKSVVSSTSCQTNGADVEYDGHRSNRNNRSSSLIVASSIQDLTLAGNWIMDNSLRSVMFKTTFPNLEKLHERFTSGYSAWEGWILSLQRKDMPRLKEVSRWLNSIEGDDGGEDGLTAVERTMKNHGMVAIQAHPMVIHGIMGQIRRLQQPPQLQLLARKEGVEQEKQEATVYYLNARPWVLAEDAPGTSISE